MRASGMRLLAALRLVLAIQWRTRFPLIYAGLAVLTVLGLRLTPLFEFRELVMPALQLGEYGTLPLLLVAAHVYFERNERSATALVVTPLRGGEYLAALAFGSALVPTAVGVAAQAAVLGIDSRLLLLLPALFLTASFSGLSSFALSTHRADFTGFLLTRFIPATTVLSLPYLSYFGVVPRALLGWMPTDAALFAFGNSVAAEPRLATCAATTALLIVWTLGAFAWAQASFSANLLGRPEYA